MSYPQGDHLGRRWRYVYPSLLEICANFIHATVAAMVYISAKLTMVMLAVVPPVSIGAVIYGRYLRKLSNQTQEALGDMSKVRAKALASLVGD
jgi:ABC-type multidrug transport system fused ATPase/permease subunit